MDSIKSFAVRVLKIITMSKKESAKAQPHEEFKNPIQHFQHLDINIDNEGLNFLELLPIEIIQKIFNLCKLRDQLILAKVSKHCREVILANYKTKYKFMSFNYINDYFTLENRELIEFFRLCGNFVENLHLIANFISRFVGTDPEIDEKYLQFHKLFTHCIQYFPNLQELEIDGNVFPDSTIRELAKHCKNLKSICFTAIENQSFRGEHLHQLENIENLNFKCCHNLNPNYLLAVSEKRHLKSLNLLQCYEFYEIPPILQLCKHWYYLETLVLFAPTSDKEFLKAIIDLPSLKSLQLNWNCEFRTREVLNFEENFFSTLSEHHNKSKKLRHIKFANDRYYSHIRTNLSQEYARMKEGFHAVGQFSQWSMEKFNLILLTFKNCKNLHTVNFHYCRPLSNEQLIKMAEMNEQLQLIKIDGCPDAGDDKFKKLWMNQKCQLELESIFTLKEVKKIYDEEKKYENSQVDRTICCQFE